MQSHAAAEEGDGFSVVISKKSQKPPREPDVQEDVWAFSTDWDWMESELRYVKMFQTTREGRRWGETKPYYHLYIPSRDKVIGRLDGKITEFRGSSEYRDLLLNKSTVPDEMLEQWQSSRKAKKKERKERKKNKESKSHTSSGEED